MTYKHLSTTELTTIYAFWKNGEKAYKVSQHLRRSKQTIYHVYHALEDGLSVVDYQERYIKNKAKCGRKRIILPVDETDYINERIKDGWTPDTIIGRSEHQISCNTRTLYRMFKRGYFDVHQLPMKGKRHPNGYVERRGKAGQLGRDIYQRYQDYPSYTKEFGHLEGDTVQGKNHKGAVVTLVERISKLAIVLNSHHKDAENVTLCLDHWLSNLPKHLFKSITFDNGKEFANWQEISNKHDISTYFAQVGAPNQRGLNENNNGLLRKDGLKKSLDFRNLPDKFVQQISTRRNHIPRKSLGYKPPIEIFMKHITNEVLTSF